MTPAESLAGECHRMEGNCLYTSASFHMWLRALRTLHVVFTAVPLVLGTFAGWSVLKNSTNPWVQGIAALCGLVAGLMPSIYSGLKVDGQIEQCKRLAGEFTNLRDRFRQAALIGPSKNFAEFEIEFRDLMKRLEAARAESLTPPGWFFKRAQKKVKEGDYDPDRIASR